MKLKDIIKISFRSARRSKSSILITILIFVTSVACLFSLSYEHSFNTYWDTYINKNPELRIRFVHYDKLLNPRIIKGDSTLDPTEKLKMIEETTNKAKEILSTNKHILGTTQTIMSYMEILDFEENGENISMDIVGVPLKNNIPLIAGENLDAYTEKDKVMICPNLIYTNSNNTVDEDRVKEFQKNIESFLGKTIKSKNSNVVNLEEYKIIGLYDTISNYSIGNICYTSYANIEYLNNKANEAIPDTEENANHYYSSVDYTGDNLYMMLDDMKNYDEVEKFLRDNNLSSSEWIWTNPETVEQTMDTCSKISIGCLILSIIVIGINLLQNLDRRKKEFYLYHTLGYTQKDIIKIIFVENSILVLIGFVLAIGVTQIGLMIYKNQVLSTKSRLYLMNPQVDIVSILISFLVSLIIPILITVILLFINREKKDKTVEKKI